MTAILLSVSTSAAEAKQFKTPGDFYKGQQGGLDPDAVEVLKKDIPLAKRVLIDCAANGAVKERQSCAVYAQYIGSADLADALANFIDDRDKEVRLTAAQSLRAIAPERASKVLLTLLEDPEPVVRESALNHIHAIGGRAANDIVRKRLADPDPAVRLTAAGLLAEDGQEISRDMIAPNISKQIEKENKKIEIKGKALILLGRVGNEKDIATFDEILSHRSDYNKRDARIGRQLLRMKLAKNIGDRDSLIDEAFRDERLRDWITAEMVRRFRSGDSSVRRIVESIAKNAGHPAKLQAEGALGLIDKRD
ncbi:MAG: HEAT repeat domain-containing protein [Elusimicrobiota bacterium]|nr:MAG: HEAT repeat domain-containing protein [Elusimicrobiota bacterium]